MTDYVFYLLADNQSENVRILRPRWWFGGVAGAVTQTVMAPFALIETRMQALKDKLSMIEAFKLAVTKQGFFSLYDGLSAQIVRQITYTSMRFHLYEVGKSYVSEENFSHKIFVAALSGVLACSVGVPTEVAHVRMQVDRALPDKQQRRYRNVLHALLKIYMQEGFWALYKGAGYAMTKAALVTIGQNAVYDQANYWYTKYLALSNDSTKLHLASSITAGFVCAPLLQPIEVLKTINMQTKEGFFKSWTHEIQYVTRFGFLGLFRGFVPAMLRLVPSTVLLFITYEQLREWFGYYKELAEV